MGAVYLAEDTRLGRQVALKTMRPDLAAKPGARERFLREARLAAALEHDHICPIYHVGEAEGVPYLAMPFLKGQSLADLIARQQKLAPAEVIRLGIQIAAGLAAAHDKGLIHRDIKPGNLWVKASPGRESGEGRVKILDFGLARSSEADTGLTQSGTILGTPSYMAPEQAKGEKLDARADLYSLGVVLYRLATGELPLKGVDTMSMLMALATQTPRPAHEVNPAVTPALSALIMRLLAKDPNARPASAQAVMQELQALHDATVSRTPPVAPASRQTERNAPNNDTDAYAPTPAAGPQPLPHGRGSGPRRRRPLVAGALLLALAPLGYFFGGTLIRIVTNQGELVVQVDDPNVETKVVQNGVVVQDKTAQRDFTLSAGKGQIEVFEKDGIKLATREFTLTRGGKTTVKVALPELTDARKPKDHASDPDRRVAEWVLSIGGKVTIRVADKEREVTVAMDLPVHSFKVVNVNLHGNEQADDAGLAHLKTLTSLHTLDLSYTKVSDAGLVHLKGLNNLMQLGLHGTQVSDAGLVHLKGLTKLTWLGLIDTRLSDAGLEHLKGLTNLRVLGVFGPEVSDAGLIHLQGLTELRTLDLRSTKVSNAGLKRLKTLTNLTFLDLKGTKVTAAGVAALRQALPQCRIESDYGTFGPIAGDPDRRAAEYVLSIGGQVEFNDQWINAPALPKEPFRLTGVNLDGNQKVTDAGLAHLKDCKGLTELHLQGTRVTDASLAWFGAQLNLNTLEISSTRIALHGYEQLEAALPKCNITWTEPNRGVAESVLALGGTVEIGTPGQAKSHPIQAAADLPRDYFQVRRVSLAGVNKPLDKLPELLSQLIFGEFDRLEKLNLTGIKGLNYAFLAPIAGLEELSLANAGLNDASLGQLPKLPALKRLVLDGNDIRGNGLAALSTQPALVDLSLGCPSLTDLWAKNLAELKQLKRLSLAGSGLGDKGIQHLESLTNPEALDLRKTKVTAAGIDRLQKALPKCKIDWDGAKQ
jgi:Leucine-rich repeat (LRR) protein